MLVLERKEDERIILTRGDERIEIVVVRIRKSGNDQYRARIGVDADLSWNIARQELLEDGDVNKSHGDS